MKKCKRCNSVIDWEKLFCPLCGGQVSDIPRPERAVPAVEAPAVVEYIGAPQAAPVVPPEFPMPPVPTPVPAASLQQPVPPPPPITQRIPVPVPPKLRTDIQAPPLSSIPGVPNVPGVPSVQNVPGITGVPGVPGAGVPGVPASPQIPTIPQAGSISQIHQTPGPTIPYLPPSPPAGMIPQVHQPAPDVDAGRLDDRLEILKSGATGAPEPEAEDPLEALLKSIQKFDADGESGKIDQGAVPDMSDDVKPSQGNNSPQDDFLRMFPGANG
ncbi:MAG: hypothetical protein FWE55_02570 [Synergistaceae bacterium]|nr:hypothetical protein [Synergistaceae bacterium]